MRRCSTRSSVGRDHARAHDVLDEHVVARLAPVAVHRRLAAGLQLAAEDRDHARLAERVLARPVHVAEPQADRRQPVQAPPQRQVSLAGVLRLAIGSLGADVGPLRGRHDVGLAVDRTTRRRVHEPACPGPARGLEHVDRPEHVHLRIERRPRRGDAHVDLSREVEHRLGLLGLEQRADEITVADVLYD
jgi:hypothetical protein